MPLEGKPIPKDPETGLPRYSNPAAHRLKNVVQEEQDEWWNLDHANELQIAGAIDERIRQLDLEQSMTRWQIMLDVMMYRGTFSDDTLAGVGLPPIFSAASMFAQLGGPVHNVVKQNIDTVVSMVTEDKPKVTFLTNGGGFTGRQKAEALTDFCVGMFEQLGISEGEIPEDILLDACTAGTGILGMGIDQSGKLVGERVHRLCCYIDEAEGTYRNPRQFYRVGFCTRGELAARFSDNPEAAQIVRNTQPTTTHAMMLNSKARGRMVQWNESFHLPDGPELEGRHVISTSAGVLKQEAWVFPWLPYAMLRWEQPRYGFWGYSFAEALRGYQFKINRLDDTIDETMRRVSAARFWVPAQAKVVLDHITNEIGPLIRYSGIQRPTLDNSNAVPPELPAERNDEIARAGTLNGVSPVEASGMVPPELKSGEALKVHRKITSQRFAPKDNRFAWWHGEVAKLGLRILKAADDKVKAYNVFVRVPGQQARRKINFKELDFDEDAYSIQVFMTNALADDPADRMDDLTDFASAGEIDRAEFLYLYDYPDLKPVTGPKTSGIKNIVWVISELMNKRWVEPQPEQDIIVHGIPYVQGALLDLQTEDAPSDVLDLFRRWLDAADVIKQKAMPPPPPAPPLAAGPKAAHTPLLPIGSQLPPGGVSPMGPQ